MTGIKITAAALIECLSKVTTTEPIYVIAGDLHHNIWFIMTSHLC